MRRKGKNNTGAVDGASNFSSATYSLTIRVSEQTQQQMNAYIYLFLKNCDPHTVASPLGMPSHNAYDHNRPELNWEPEVS